ncbi:MAG: tRNA pseudouridine(55) synthase TruB [Coriobacteriales bacterium]|nr:tRNA pseudouridine(55) synthase TruB [Coriobacteriales bacterium]
MKRKSSGINALIGINKPVGVSSHDVVNAVRRQLGESRVGHAGTLDPLASGVLIIGVGQATRLLGYITAESKSYRVTVAFGRQTSTGDAEGPTTGTAPVFAELSDLDFAREQMNLLLQMTQQVPPSYSAVHVDGKRAYALARNGENVILEPRDIHIYEANMLEVGVNALGEPEWTFDTVVSKGTYMRTLASDLAGKLGTMGYVSSLCRTASGTVTLADCITVDEVQNAVLQKGSYLNPLEVLNRPILVLNSQEVANVLQGKRLSASKTCDAKALAFTNNTLFALVNDTKLFALAERCEGALVLQCVFPDGIDGCLWEEL